MASADGWDLVGRFRDNLAEASPLRARFEQSYLPAGFSTAEVESGGMALALPDCLRWDYDDPFPKSFILCGDVFHYWNDGESEGHREEIEAREQPGLDLLLLDVAELRSRYSVELGPADGKTAEIVLRPLESNEYAAEATLVLDTKLTELRELAYLDPEGNRTTFEISGYRSGVKRGTFNPPEDVSWVEY